MSPEWKRTWAEISMDNIAGNYRQIRQKLHKGCKLMVIVKADAYGHGAAAVVGLMRELGADWLGVATIYEAIGLREAGNNLPILILGPTPPELTNWLISHNLAQTVYDVSGVFKPRLALGRKLNVHIKVDTGMTRLGIPCKLGADEDNALRQIQELRRLPGLTAEGIFTHFANADVKDDAYTLLEFDPGGPAPNFHYNNAEGRRKNMKKLEMIIKPEKLENVKSILNQSGIYGVTITMVSGCGNQKGYLEVYRGTEISFNLLPKVKVEIVVKDEAVETLMTRISEAVRTGAVGDGKIFVCPVEDAMRIRTGERGKSAL